jgi:iron complex transport system ATP-binding protein
MLKLKNVFSGYGGADIIKDINFEAERGAVLCIVGPNGCGKSTLLRTLINVLPYKGSITIDEKEVSTFPRKILAKKIALMGQSEYIYFPYTVRDTISLGRYAYSSGFFKSFSKEDSDIINNLIERLGLGEVQNTIINELSGGQLQRVFLARTLAQTPDIILLDEPTNHLDLSHQIELLQLLREWAKENNKTVVAVLHDLNLVQCYADTAIIMNNGKIVSHGNPQLIFNGDILKETYGIDVKQFMLESLSKWTEPPGIPNLTTNLTNTTNEAVK